MNAWHISSLVCTLIGLLLLLIALASDYWMDNGTWHAGVWKICTINGCANLGSGIGGHFHAVRSFLILGMLDGIIATGLLCALFCSSEIGSFSILKKAAVCNYSAGCFALIAMAAYTGFEGSLNIFSWSFGLGWACCPLFFIAGGLAHKQHMSRGAYTGV